MIIKVLIKKLSKLIKSFTKHLSPEVFYEYFFSLSGWFNGSCVFCSRFYLGGPTSVRGFGMYSIGPQSEGKDWSDVIETVNSADYLNSHKYSCNN